jgi:hypothetical protein
VVKQIVHYLKGTADKGMIFSTVDKASVDCYVDADFAGAFDKDGDTQDPATACSWTGYIVFAYRVPICWGSKLQTEVALSTMEAEYIALATATREVLGLHNLLEEISNEMDIAKTFRFTTLSQIFEDTRLCVPNTLPPNTTSSSLTLKRTEECLTSERSTQRTKQQTSSLGLSTEQYSQQSGRWSWGGEFFNFKLINELWQAAFKREC